MGGRRVGSGVVEDEEHEETPSVRRVATIC
jgi:hypothetical protein